MTSEQQNSQEAKSIVLVGLMGCGKTTVGRRLAARLRVPFVDADQEIEAAAGKSIPDIFEEHGEAHFRDREYRVIQRLLVGPAKVLATGGGAFMRAETRRAIAEAGVSVWLRAEFDVLMRRVRKRDNRPLLQTANPENTMRELIAQRYPIYAQADFVVESRDVAHDVVVDDIVRVLDDAGLWCVKSSTAT